MIKKMIGFKPFILISVIAEEKIQKVKLFAHNQGFACEIHGKPSEELAQQIFEFLECYGFDYPCTLPLDWYGMTPFTKKILNCIATLPFGNTCSYAQIAQNVHSPRASRAVGQACGRNPFPFFIPCHRVLPSHRFFSKKCEKSWLGGYSEGVEIKKRLLEFERFNVF